MNVNFLGCYLGFIPRNPLNFGDPPQLCFCNNKCFHVENHDTVLDFRNVIPATVALCLPVCRCVNW